MADSAGSLVNGRCAVNRPVGIDTSGTRPASYHECSGNGEAHCLGETKPVVKKSSSAVLSSYAISGQNSRVTRKSKPLKALHYIFRKLKPGQKNSHSSEVSASKWECSHSDSCNPSDLSGTGVDESVAIVSEIQAAPEVIPRQCQHPAANPNQARCDCIPLTLDQCDISENGFLPTVDCLNDAVSSVNEVSLTLAELILNSSDDSKDDAGASVTVSSSNGGIAATEGERTASTANHTTAAALPLRDSPSSLVSNRREQPVSAGESSVLVSPQIEAVSPVKWTLAQELNKLSHYGWYWGPISREEAEEKLLDQPEGAFLVRDSTDDRYLFSLSFRSSNRTLHSRVEYCNGEFSFYAQPQFDSYRSMVDLIERCIADSQSGVYCYSRGVGHSTGGGITNGASYPVKLTRPVSRFAQVRSLQYLCRFVIRQHTRVDHIQNLPLPLSVKGWLKENQY